MRDHTNETVAILAGIGIGAALMFFLDPHRHNGRRPQAIGESPATLRAVDDIDTTRGEPQDDAQRAELIDAQMR